MTRPDRWLLIISYLILVATVAFGAFYLPHAFENEHDQDCALVVAAVEIVGVRPLADLHNPAAAERFNRAVIQLNDECDTDIPTRE